MSKEKPKECPMLRYAMPYVHGINIAGTEPPSEKIECELLNSMDQKLSVNATNEYKAGFCFDDYTKCEYHKMKGIVISISNKEAAKEARKKLRNNP